MRIIIGWCGKGSINAESAFLVRGAHNSDIAKCHSIAILYYGSTSCKLDLTVAT